VTIAYPWGEPGTLLERIEGPDTWQVKFLADIGKEVRRNNFDGYTLVMPVQRAVSSGHGIGKGVMTAWLVDWLMVTRPNCQGVVGSGVVVSAAVGFAPFFGYEPNLRRLMMEIMGSKPAVGFILNRTRNLGGRLM
jgi:hypothetical protein